MTPMKTQTAGEIIYLRDSDCESSSLEKAFQHIFSLNLRAIKTRPNFMKVPKLARICRQDFADLVDTEINFESRFESGNLYLAQKLSDSEFNLLMQNDINTRGHT